MIARSAIVALAIAGSAIVLGAAPRQDAKADVATDSMVAVGVACGDGTFMPLAARTKGVWRPLSQLQENINYTFGLMSAQALRLPRQGWTLYRGNGESRPLSLESVRRKDIGESSECYTMQGFRSDAPRLRRPLCSGCTPSAQVVGIGVVGPARFERDDVTAQPDEMSRRVAARLVQDVHAVERQVVRRYERETPLDRFAGRKEVRSVVHLLTMVRYRTDDGEWYFFQARKRYGEWYEFEGKRLYKDWARVLVHGWVRTSPQGLFTHGLSGGFVDDDGKESTIYRMAGVLVLGDRVVWISEVHQYELQSYELFELGPGEARPRSVLSVIVYGT